MKNQIMELTITKKEQLDRWLNERRSLSHDVFSIKGVAPKGATYSDGDPITRPINIAWQDGATGEVFVIEYEMQQRNEQE